MSDFIGEISGQSEPLLSSFDEPATTVLIKSQIVNKISDGAESTTASPVLCTNQQPPQQPKSQTQSQQYQHRISSTSSSSASSLADSSIPINYKVNILIH